ncbi:sensor histidine kinase [Vallitalea pronyensis]|uniref:Sensor histidine kinase n=1 Tax=Vallitalea pronyensis TaxID=1348613 RepID=A0A8J8MJK7_9FIRM|nr:sensor histidine kinase [Vallitalea pronyensis]QUI22473.1 sensor histidine kinase [Vallitalea pronyensis]
MIRNRKIGTKLLMSFSLIIIFTSLLISVLSYKITSNVLEKNLKIYSDEYLAQLSRNLENTLEDLNDDLFNSLSRTGLLNRKILHLFMNEANQNNDLLGLDFNRRVSEVLASNVSVKAILIQSIYQQSYFQRDPQVSIDIEQLHKVLSDNTQRYAVLRNLNERYVVIIKPLFDLSNTQLIGHAAIVVEQTYFTNEFKKNQTYKEWEVLILDKNEVIIAENEAIRPIHDYISKEIASSGKVQHVFDYNNKAYMVNVVTSPKKQIRVMNIIPMDSVTRASNRLLVVIVWACMGALLSSFVIALVTTAGFSKNIKILVDNIRSFKDGQFDTSVEINSNDEIGLISHEFNKMTKEINHLITEVYHEQLLKEKARKESIKFEYDALQAKMNPHFLYNILESINGMAKIQGNHEISEVVCLLGELLRDSISDERTNIFLEDELAYTEKYLALKQITSKNNIEVVYDIDEILLGAVVPKFILQPIVENAIVHGISKQLKKGKIYIKCGEINGDLVLEVQDNGLGFNQDKLPTVDNKQGRWQRTRVGIKSIDKRLKILFGNAYGVEIHSEEGKGTLVKLRMPYRTDIDSERGGH